MQQNFLTGDPLSLDRIRSTLIRLEDTIIFGLIERAQFAHNLRIYERGGFKDELNIEGSWLDWFLKETETFHAKARRFTSPDEYPFTPLSELPKPLLPPLPFPSLLHPNNINVNSSIKSLYTRSIIPRITKQATRALATVKRAQGVQSDSEYEDDGNYGSAATLDIEILQAISKRVHYGKFVSESKFRAHPSAFIPHIRNGDRAALDGLITKPEVERKLLLRVRNKARQYGQDLNGDRQSVKPIDVGSAEDSTEGKIDVEGVVEFYERYIIPLTKEVEVDYLLVRLDGLSGEEIDALSRQLN